MLATILFELGRAVAILVSLGYTLACLAAA